MENVQNMPSATFESVWAAIQETNKQMQETDRKMQETDRRMQETDRQMQETDRRMKELQKTVGGMANNQGAFAEEYFFNSFEKGQKNFFGEKFDEIDKNLKNHWRGLKDEYDIVLYNHASVAIIEVKYKANISDVPDVLKKAETFRILFSNYRDFKIYLGLASLSFYPELEQECINQGIAIIKQVGDAVVINDRHLKVF
ncbi:MAG: hypothetical protein LBE91_18725 [Tannerella sp.]|jgi:hypothetical protein|nr:hypothetical protein [Tannerella sp.]